MAIERKEVLNFINLMMLELEGITTNHTEDTTLAEVANGDSLLSAEVTMGLEEHYGIELPDDFGPSATLGHVIDTIVIDTIFKKVE